MIMLSLSCEKNNQINKNDVHSTISLRSNLLIHLDKSTAVVDKNTITAAVLNIDPKHEHNLFRISQ